MSNPNNQPIGEPTLADLLAAINSQNEQFTALTQRIDQMQGVQDQLVGHINDGIDGGDEQEGIDAEQLERLHNATDEQLAELGITREEVDAAVSEYNQSVIDSQAQGQDQDPGEQGNEQAVGVEAAAGGQGAGGQASVAMSALYKELNQLKANLKARDAREQNERETIQFNEVRGKINVLAEQRNKAIELAEKLVAENEALRMHVKTGVRPAGASGENLRLFSADDSGELHPFQQRIRDIKLSEKCTDGKALMLASKENPTLHADWLTTQKGRQLARS